MKKFFDDELVSTLVHAAAGIAAGYASFQLGRPEFGAAVALACLGAVMLVLKYAFKIGKDYRWFLSNGTIVYVFAWFLIWTIFHTLRVWSTLP